ncbi:MAG TPA: IS1595 family transposase [Candidatus Angelobacter sp.]|jgi:transposase-like protein|nr:IS1595 family transposase [Candidatus Angelobacter sp.]
MKAIKTLQQAIQHFSDYENCREFMVAVRWPDGKVRCPACGSEKVTYLKNARVYRCYEDHPRQKFSLKVGTVFEDSPIGLDKWLPAVWLLVSCKNGISSYEIHRGLGVTQKTAWFMMHRIRLAVQSNSFVKLGGSGKEVEVDETFIGGKARNMHKSVRARRITGQGHNVDDKSIVMGILDRSKKKVRTQVITDRKKDTLYPIVKKHVMAGTALYSDELTGYMGLGSEYERGVVDHAVAYVDEKIHTNGMENYWSLFKRGLNGTYVSVEPFHLFRYLDEQEFRYNNRATKDNPLNDGDRFQLAMSQIVGKRLTYAHLTGKDQVGETEPF